MHRAAPAAKLMAFALVLVAVIVSANLLVVLGVTLSLLGLLAAMRLPARPMLALAAYPGLFAALYAFAAAAEPLTGALIVAKAVTAALAAVLLMFTTPYPQVFAPIQRVVPAVIGDALLMTYRSLFLLLERFGHMLTAARLRSGLVGVHPSQSARVITRSLGGVLLYSIDLSQRTYDIMHLRGYDGRLVVSTQKSRSRAADAGLVAGGATLATAGVFWRVGGAMAAPFAWIALLGGACALLVGSAVGTFTRKEAA
jgi:energy-coupling factor transporter transmembrane protein EcfT